VEGASDKSERNANVEKLEMISADSDREGENEIPTSPTFNKGDENGQFLTNSTNLPAVKQNRDTEVSIPGEMLKL